MDFRILGPFEVWEGTEQLRLDAPRQRAILALLTVHAGEVLSTDRIVDDLWGDDPPSSPQNTLRYHVSKLRTSLGEVAVHLVTRSPGYVLDIAPEATDAYRFEQLAAEGRSLIADEPERAARVLADALGMWRGSPLADFTYESFARSEITRLEELRLSVLEDRIDADLASGRQGDLVGELEALVAEHPLRERLWGQLMTALYRSGRQAEALRAYQQARDALGEIGIEPSEELRAVEERVLLQDPVLQAVRRPERRHNLPERMSSFVGRSGEIEQVEELLGKHRLVTLTGVGGVGKSSLAIEASRPLLDSYPDGVWVLTMADVGDPDLIPERLAHVLGVQIRSAAGLVEQLGDYFSEREALLVFDGCERHVDAVAMLVESLLRAAPSLWVLATSRESLELVGESRFDVPVLSTDGANAGAVHLFEDRAGLVQPGFGVTSGNVDLVIQICRRVAGIPLAVELAAARLGALTLDQIGQRLDDQMTLLARSRRGESPHGSLRAVLDWSHELLDPVEATLFRRLSVFQGGATTEAAQQVCAGETLPADAVLDLLARLVDVSLVVRDCEAGRFEMLDPVRQYAAGCLDDADETERLRRRHATYYRDLARRAFDGAFGPDEVEWSHVCAQEEPNHIAAVTWALAGGESALAVDTGTYLTPFWHKAGRVATQDRFLGLLLDEARKGPSRELVILLVHAAYLESGNGPASLAEEALAVARELDDEFSIGHALMRKGAVVGWSEDFGRGVDITKQAFEYLNRIGHPQAMPCLLNLAGMLVRVADETGERLREAEAAARDLLAQAEGVSSLSQQAMAHQALGWVAQYRGDLDMGRTHTLTAVRMHGQGRADRWIAFGGQTLVNIELAAGNTDRAVAYHEEFGLLFKEIWGSVLLPIDGVVQLAVGDTEGGIRTLLGALDMFADSDEVQTAQVLIALAAAGVDLEDWLIACRLYAGAEAIRARKNLALTADESRNVAEDCARLRIALGDDAFESEWSKGEAMTVKELAAYARATLQPERTP